MKSCSAWFIVCSYLGLFFCLGVMRIDNINTKAQLNQVKNDTVDVSILRAQHNILLTNQINGFKALQALSEESKYHGVDIAQLKITRSATIDEVDRLIQESLKADNANEDEYNSLVAATIMNIEENMALISKLQLIEREIIKKQVLDDLKEK